jgi:hypothetical protein
VEEERRRLRDADRTGEAMGVGTGEREDGGGRRLRRARGRRRGWRGFGISGFGLNMKVVLGHIVCDKIGPKQDEAQ